MKYIRLVAFYFAVFMLFCGCKSASFEVNDSQLNWIHISYKPIAPKSKPCKIDLIGVGYLEFTEGISPRVASDFSIDTENENWHDVYQEKLGVPPDVIRGWLQRFADAGLMTEAERKPSSKEKSNFGKSDIAYFKANLNMKKTACMTSNEKLLEPVRELISIIKQDK